MSVCFKKNKLKKRQAQAYRKMIKITPDLQCMELSVLDSTSGLSQGHLSMTVSIFLTENEINIHIRVLILGHNVGQKEIDSASHPKRN